MTIFELRKFADSIVADSDEEAVSLFMKQCQEEVQSIENGPDFVRVWTDERIPGIVVRFSGGRVISYDPTPFCPGAAIRPTSP